MELAPAGEHNSQELGEELLHGVAGKLIRGKVRSICRSLHLTQADGEDLEQELCLEVLTRAAKFDPERGTWKAFVSTVTNSRARTHYRRLRRLSRPMPFSDVLDDPGTSIPEHERLRHRGMRTHPSDAELPLDVQIVREQLGLDAQMLTEMLQVFSVTETSRELRIPRSTLDDRVRQLQKPFAELRCAPASETECESPKSFVNDP